MHCCALLLCIPVGGTTEHVSVPVNSYADQLSGLHSLERADRHFASRHVCGSSNKSLVQDCVAVLRKFMENANTIKFNMIALAKTEQ